MSDLSTGLSDSIVRFYRGDGQDDKGRTLHEILAFTDQKLESQHDYIQVLFPLPESSLFHPTAPILTKTTHDVFASDEKLQDELYESFIRLANLYAFDVSGPKSAVHMCPKSDFQRLARVTWLKRVDHNHLRISRIIRCLRILSLEHVAAAFHKALKDNDDGRVSSRSLTYWDRAAQRPLHLPPSEDDESAEGIAWLHDFA